MIDLTLLPAPDVIEALDYEAILGELKTLAIGHDASLAGVLQYEFEPLTKLLQVFAYRELTLRHRTAPMDSRVKGAVPASTITPAP